MGVGHGGSGCSKTAIDTGIGLRRKIIVSVGNLGICGNVF